MEQMSQTPIVRTVLKMKVSEIAYKRIDADRLLSAIDRFAQQATAANSGKQLADIRSECVKEINHFSTMAALSNMRYTLNSRDEFYSGEREYYDEQTPRVMAAQVRFQRALLRSPYAQDSTRYMNPLVLQLYRLNVECITDEAVPLMVEENKLTTEYSKLMSETLYEFRGAKMPLALLRKYFTDADRNTRKEAYEAAGKTLASISDRLDGLFDALIKVRHKIAVTLGYENYVELGDKRMNRYSYDRKDIAAFREIVRTSLVPLVAQLKAELGNRIGAQPLMLYDNDTYFLSGNPSPILSPEEMFETGKRMYESMSKETGEFFEMMLNTDAFDVFPRDGKWGGGYCTSFLDYKQPFILANFNGTSGDVDVLTHEAGHAFADYMMYKQNHDTELNVGGMETAETHSMSMEFFCWKYIDEFFGSRGKDYRYMHLFDALSFIPYGTIVDYFQQLCYQQPDMTPAQRNDLWLRLEHEFRPYMSADGIPYLEKGTRWQYQMHIYESPLYYIDYCLAQSVAMQFLLASQTNYADAFARYKRFLSQGGEKDFPSLIADAGLQSPFSDGLTHVFEQCIELLKKLK